MTKQKKTKLYARALAEIIAKKGIDEEKVVNNFLKLLVDAGQKKNALAGQARVILDLAEEFFLAKQGKKKITFETARKMTDSQAKLMDKFVKKGDIVKEKINPEIIAGVKIIINNEKQFDNSMLSKLNNIL